MPPLDFTTLNEAALVPVVQAGVNNHTTISSLSVILGAAGVPLYAVLAGELGVTDTRYPPLHFHRYGAVGDGIVDDVAAINATIVAAPAGSTIYGLPGVTYKLGTAPNFTKALVVDGLGSTWKASAAMAVVASTVDKAGMEWRNLTVDGNGLAVAGFKSLASASALVNKVSFINCHVTNLAVDHTLIPGAFWVTGNATHRHKDVTIDNCSAKNCPTAGAYIYFTDGAKLTNWTGSDLDNHSFEINNSTDFTVSSFTSTDCGGSGGAFGLQSYHGVAVGGTITRCFGDAGFTVENTSADIRVSNIELRGMWKAALSANHGGIYTYPNDLMRGIHYSNISARAAVPVVITGATKSNPCKLTIPNHGIKTIYLSNTTQVSIAGVVGMTALNGTTPTVTSINPVTLVHDANAVWLVGVNSTGYGTYTSGGTMAPFCNGANLYGGAAPQAVNISCSDMEFNDFNCGVAMLYMDSSECRNIRVSGLQGPLSAVARFTYFTNGSVSGIRNSDINHQPSDPLGAIQFLNQFGTANSCTRVVANDLNVLQCGPTSNYPLVYTEGSGDFTFTTLTTGGASCAVSTRAAADSPTIRLRGLSVTLSTGTLIAAGAGSTPVQIIEYPQIPRTIAGSGTAVYYDGVLRMDSSAANRTLTLPLGATMIGKRLTVVRTDASANTVTVSATAPDTLASATLRGAKADQAFTVEAWSGGWNVVSANHFPPAPVVVNAAATDLPTVIALTNQLRALLITLEEAS